MKSPVRRFVAASTACALGLGGVLLAVGPASADSSDISNEAIYWLGVEDNALEIRDAIARYQDLLGSGYDVDGWTGDAFDSFIYSFEADDGGGPEDFVMTPVSFDIQDGGVSTIVAEGEADLGDGNVVSATVTLTVQGSYARWTVETAGPDTAALWISGELGSDSGTEYNVVSPTTLVSSDEAPGWDPIIGYQLLGDGASFDVVDGDDMVYVDFPVGSTMTLVMALQDYDPCARDAALAAMAARVASLSSTFGETIPLLDTACLAIDAPVAFAAGTPTDQTLSVEDISVSPEPGPDSALVYWLGYPYFETRFEGEEIFFISEGLPAGLTLDFDPDSVTLHLTGTAAAGTYPVRIGFFHSEPYDGEDYRHNPLLSTLSLVVTGDDEAVDPELAATGVSDATPAVAMFGGLLLLVGAAALGGLRVASRRR